MRRKINAFHHKLVIFLGISLGVGTFVDNFSLEKIFEGRVEMVLDGDTIIVSGQKVRLIGIDAPEIDQFAFDGTPIGENAKKFLSSLLVNKIIKVKYRKRGYYGRILGEVRTDIDINKEMLLAGHAIFSRYSKRRDLYLVSYLARLKSRGMFATSGFLNPYHFRRKKSRD